MSDLVFGRDYEVCITRPPQIVEVSSGNRGSPRNVMAAVQDITMDGIASLRQGVIDFDYASAFTGQDSNWKMGGVNKIGEETIIFTPPLHMEADISYDSPNANGGSGKCTLRLYNLSNSSVNKIKKGYLVLVKAGYKTQGTLFSAFIGQIDKVSTDSTQDGTTITEIVCSERTRVKSQGSYQACFKFAAGTPIRAVFDKFIDTFNIIGIPEGQFDANEDMLKTLEEPLVINKPLTQALSDMCDSVNYIWTISGGRLYILPKYNWRPVQVVNITPDLVKGRIQALSSKSTEEPSEQDSSETTGIKVELFFTSAIRPENYVQIGYGDYSGLYKPTKINYDLGYTGGNWAVIAELQAVGAGSIKT